MMGRKLQVLVTPNRSQWCICDANKIQKIVFFLFSQKRESEEVRLVVEIAPRGRQYKYNYIVLSTCTSTQKQKTWSLAANCSSPETHSHHWPADFAPIFNKNRCKPVADTVRGMAIDLLNLFLVNRRRLCYD